MSKQSPFDRLSTRQAKRMLRALDAAVAHAGSWSELAALLSDTDSITPQGVFRWTVKGIPAERVVDIEKATGGRVLRQDLRPDLYDGMKTQ